LLHQEAVEGKANELTFIPALSTGWRKRSIPAARAALFNLFDGRKCVLKDVLKVG